MKILNKLCFAIVCLLVVGGLQLAEAQTRRHTVEPGQTLFRIAKYYGVTVQSILNANPGLEVTSVPAGTTLVIPKATQAPENIPLTPEAEVQSTVKKAETQTTVKSPATEPSHTQPAVNWTLNGESHWTDGTLNMAVILPFNLNAEATPELNSQMRSVEFYEGALMAVDEMQAKGRRVAVQAYDLGSESLYSILAKPELQLADFVIAPMDEKDVRQVADWGERNGTPVVSPFGFNAEMLNTHEYLIQLNTSKALLYPRLSTEMLSLFSDYTFIFVSDSVGNQKADPYPAQLKQTLKVQGIPYKEISYLSPNRLMACDSILGLKNENIVFVPVTPQKEAMRRMFSGLQHVKILREARYQEAVENGVPNPVKPKMAMLGYPEWVQYTGDFIEYYYDLNVYMFTKLYASPFDPGLKSFYSTFRRWYGKEPMPLTPKYGVLGYDVASYFLQQLTRSGQHLEERLADQDEDGLQTYFGFDHMQSRGYCNSGFYLVHFTPESTIEKIKVK